MIRRVKTATRPPSTTSSCPWPAARCAPTSTTALFAKLGTDTADPLERLYDMAERNRNAKDHHSAISADALPDWAEFAAPG